MQEPPGRPDEPAAPAREATPVVEVVPPATVRDLRDLRRWLLVVGAWAVAATAIAVIALVVANRAEEEEGVRTANRIRELQGRLDGRIDRLESRIAELPASEDISNLDSRLGELEASSGAVSRRLARLGGELDGLEQRVEELEEAAAAPDTEPETSP